MKTLLTSLLCVSLIGCGATSNPTTVTNPTKPSPNVGVIVAATALVASCSVVEVSTTSANLQAWLASECAPTAATILAIVEASGTAAKIQAAITALQLSYTSAPAGTFTVKDQGIINASIVSAQSVLTVYEAATGQTLTAYRHSPITLAAFEVKPQRHKLSFTRAEHKQLESLRKKAAVRAKKKK